MRGVGGGKSPPSAKLTFELAFCPVALPIGRHIIFSLLDPAKFGPTQPKSGPRPIRPDLGDAGGFLPVFSNVSPNSINILRFRPNLAQFQPVLSRIPYAEMILPTCCANPPPKLQC